MTSKAEISHVPAYSFRSVAKKERAAAQKPSPILSLPDELLELVFSFLFEPIEPGLFRPFGQWPSKSKVFLLKAMKTCRRAYRIGLPLLMRHIEVPKPRFYHKLAKIPPAKLALIQYLNAEAPGRQQLSAARKFLGGLSGLREVTPHRYNGDLIRFIAMLPPTLPLLLLPGYGFSWESLRDVLTRFRNLQIFLMDPYDDIDWFLTIPGVTERLVKIDVCLEDFQDLSKYQLPKLRHLGIMFRYRTGPISKRELDETLAVLENLALLEEVAFWGSHISLTYPEAANFLARIPARVDKLGFLFAGVLLRPLDRSRTFE